MTKEFKESNELSRLVYARFNMLYDIICDSYVEPNPRNQKFLKIYSLV